MTRRFNRQAHRPILVAIAVLLAVTAGCSRKSPPKTGPKPVEPPEIEKRPTVDELSQAVTNAGGDVEKALLKLAGKQPDDFIARDSQGNISYVNLSDKKLTDDGLKHLLKLKPSLQRLNLNRTYVTDAALEVISELENLRKLEVAQSPISDDGMKHIAKLKQLRDLNLKGTRITDKGVAQLAGLEHLNYLNLTWTGVTDSGTSDLGRIAQLETLLLENTKVTDSGLNALQPLKRLRHLYLSETQVTANGVAKFQQAAPQVQVRGP